MSADLDAAAEKFEEDLTLLHTELGDELHQPWGIERLIKQAVRLFRAAIGEKLAKYELLREAVNSSGDCLEACDSYGHEEECPRVHTSKWLEQQQAEIKRLRASLSERREEVEALRAALDQALRENTRQAEVIRYDSMGLPTAYQNLIAERDKARASLEEKERELRDTDAARGVARVDAEKFRTLVGIRDREIEQLCDRNVRLLDDVHARDRRIKELEVQYESSHASRVHAEACVERLEAEVRRLKGQKTEGR